MTSNASRSFASAPRTQTTRDLRCSSIWAITLESPICPLTQVTPCATGNPEPAYRPHNPTSALTTPEGPQTSEGEHRGELENAKPFVDYAAGAGVPAERIIEKEIEHSTVIGLEPLFSPRVLKYA